VTRVKTAEVVVELELAVIFALIPVTGRGNAVLEGTVMQHGQIKATAVPGHQCWQVAVNAGEETGDDVFLVGVFVAQRPYPEAIACAQSHGNAHHTLQMMAQEIGTAGFLTTQGKQGIGRVVIAQSLQTMNAAGAFYVGHGLDVKNENIVHGVFRPSAGMAHAGV
jgi:hypothetical protein